MSKDHKNLCVKIRLTLFKNGKVVRETTRRKKIKIIRIAERISHDKSHLKVDYGIGCNESIHYGIESLKKALNSYTEKAMIEFIGGTGEN